MSRILTRSFFERSTVKVARDLLGKFLIRRSGSRTSLALMITEVEAYDGFYDKASHANRGKTKRNAPMFGEAGHWYIYFTYGMHWMLNIVTGAKDYPAAVLIRGIRSRTYFTINGPGRVTKFLKIDKRFNGKLANQKTGLWIEDRGVRVKKSDIKKSPRIGVSYAGPAWSKRYWRFYTSSNLT